MAHASAEMPYFIKPSVNLSPEDKSAAYQAAQAELNALLAGETHSIMKMATINCVLKTKFPYYYWVGFYLVHEERLIVGPYQGTMGCLHIEFGKGVCGTVAATQETKIVGEVHQLIEGEGHITCDPNSQSEIVVPVFDQQGELIAVFDVDSTLPYSFDQTDQQFLEAIMQTVFAT